MNGAEQTSRERDKDEMRNRLNSVPCQKRNIQTGMVGQMLPNSTTDFFITFNTENHNQQFYIVPNTSILYPTNQYHTQQNQDHIQQINITFNIQQINITLNKIKITFSKSISRSTFNKSISISRSTFDIQQIKRKISSVVFVVEIVIA